ARRASQLVQLRRAQASAALTRAVALQPDLAKAHAYLAGLYQEMGGYLDLTLKHLSAYEKLTRGGGGRGRGPVPPSEEEVRRLAAEVAEREAAYAAEAPQLRLLDRAMLAFQKGLAGKARDLLLESDVSAFGAQGTAMELELLLRTGRVKEVRDWTTPEQKA